MQTDRSRTLKKDLAMPMCESWRAFEIQALPAGSKMGISPITNVGPLTFARSTQGDLEPLPMERIENSARSGDETYTPSSQKFARGADDDSPDGESAEDDFEDATGDTENDSNPTPAAQNQKAQISFFA
jgi:hypothetical protein